MLSLNNNFERVISGMVLVLMLVDNSSTQFLEARQAWIIAMKIAMNFWLEVSKATEPPYSINYFRKWKRAKTTTTKNTTEKVLIFITFHYSPKAYNALAISGWFSFILQKTFRIRCVNLSQMGIGGVIIWWAKRKRFVRDFFVVYFIYWERW